MPSSTLIFLIGPRFGALRGSLRFVANSADETAEENPFAAVLWAGTMSRHATHTYSLTKNATPVSGSTRFTQPPPAAFPAVGSAVGSETGSAGASAK